MNLDSHTYDVIVVGGGHAGCEAALAAARIGCETLLLTIDIDRVAAMPCSPSIGGVAKGQIVRDIDALGGEMARVADRSAIQYRTLNTSKGPAVQSTRTQNDKWRYHTAMKKVLECQPRLHLRQALVDSLVLEDGRVAGARDATGFVFTAPTVVITTGTFLSGLIHLGTSSVPAGRAGEFASYGLAQDLRRAGFELGRMKTGTPARLRRSSIDFGRFTEQPGDPHPRPFSLSTEHIELPQVRCYLGATNERVHRIVRENLEHSALYSGRITGVPARYCPSFEDKIVRFADRDHHPLILEPEGLDSEEMYLSGLGNSLPVDIQIELVRAVDGLGSAEITRPAYAIEYDFVNPLQLRQTLETKLVDGLYLAGQINGTSGYEEAAGQGFWAGVNAALRVRKRPPFVPDRSQTYLAVMVDDLVTRGTAEPYRMFTSRAEYRLLLREDNADERLMELGHELGLVGDDAVAGMRERYRRIRAEAQRLRTTVVAPSDTVNRLLTMRDSAPLRSGVTLDKILKRPGLTYSDVAALEGATGGVDQEIGRRVEIAIKYEGFIERQLREVAQFRDLESVRIPAGLDYAAVHGLSNELKEKLARIMPSSLGQASRIPGITPAAITMLMLHMRRAPARPAADRQETETDCEAVSDVPRASTSPAVHRPARQQSAPALIGGVVRGRVPDSRRTTRVLKRQRARQRNLARA